MLDQNTDRMWYVIGAVIVGAALIFLMNGTFPTLFANIGETFDGKVEQSTEMTDGIRPPTRGEDMGFDMKKVGYWEGAHQQWVSDTAIQLSSNSNYMGGLSIPTDYFVLGKTYSIAFDITKLSGDMPGLGGHLFLTNDTRVTIDGNPVETWSGGSTSPLNVNQWSKSVVYPNDLKKHHVELHFTFNEVYEDALATTDTDFYIQPNRSGRPENYIKNALPFKVLIEDVTFYEHP